MPQKYTASKRPPIEAKLSETGLKSSRDTFLRTIGAIYGKITKFVPQFPSARTPRSFRVAGKRSYEVTKNVIRDVALLLEINAFLAYE